MEIEKIKTIWRYINMAGAYYEKIARVNLTTGEIKIEKLDLELAHKFIGGRGLGTKIL